MEAAWRVTRDFVGWDEVAAEVSQGIISMIVQTARIVTARYRDDIAYPFVTTVDAWIPCAFGATSATT